MKFIFKIFIAILLLISCSSPEAILEKGRFKRAIHAALSGIEKGENIKLNKKVLNQAMRRWLEQENEEVNALLNTKEIEDGEKAYTIRKKMSTEITSALPYLDQEIVDYQLALNDEIDTMTNQFYSNYYNWGIWDLENAKAKEDKNLARDAFRYFKKAKKYTDHHDELDSLLVDSKVLGTIYYYIESDDLFSGHSWDIDLRFDDLENEGGIFNEISYENGNSRDADCYIELSFQDIDIDDHVTSDKQVFTRDIYKGTETSYDDEGNPVETEVWEEVLATIDIKTTERSAEWELRIEVNNQSGYCDFSDHFLKAEFTVERIEYIFIDGDQRAIPESYLNPPKRPERWDEDEIAEELLDDLYQQVRRIF